MLIAESQPRLVHERGWLEGVSLALAPHHELRLTAKLSVHQPDERVARLSFSRAPCAQELGDSVHSVPRGAASGGGWRSGRG